MKTMRWSLLLAVALCMALFAGCGRKKVGKTVFPGTPEYGNRAATLRINERDARERALRTAREQGREYEISSRPTALYERNYVFSQPASNGAELKGYHVDGDTGEVRYWTKSKVVNPK